MLGWATSTCTQTVLVRSVHGGTQWFSRRRKKRRVTPGEVKRRRESVSLSGLSLPPLFSPFVGWGTGRGGGEGSCAISALQATAGASSLSLSLPPSSCESFFPPPFSWRMRRAKISAAPLPPSFLPPLVCSPLASLTAGQTKTNSRPLHIFFAPVASGVTCSIFILGRCHRDFSELPVVVVLSTPLSSLCQGRLKTCDVMRSRLCH